MESTKEEQLEQQVASLQTQVDELEAQVKRLNQLHFPGEIKPSFVEVFADTVESCLRVAAEELEAEILELNYEIIEYLDTQFVEGYELRVWKEKKPDQHPVCCKNIKIV